MGAEYTPYQCTAIRCGTDVNKFVGFLSMLHPLTLIFSFIFFSSTSTIQHDEIDHNHNWWIGIRSRNELWMNEHWTMNITRIEKLNENDWMFSCTGKRKTKLKTKKSQLFDLVCTVRAITESVRATRTQASQKTNKSKLNEAELHAFNRISKCERAVIGTGCSDDTSAVVLEVAMRW